MAEFGKVVKNYSSVIRLCLLPIYNYYCMNILYNSYQKVLKILHAFKYFIIRLYFII